MIDRRGSLVAACPFAEREAGRRPHNFQEVELQQHNSSSQKIMMNNERTEVEPSVAPEIANGLEQTQIGKYHTKGGTGFAAEDANAFADRIMLRKVKVTGTSNEANGSDRVV